MPSVFTEKENAAEDWNCIASMILTSFIISFAFWHAYFICVYFVTAVWLFWDEVWIFVGEDKLATLPLHFNCFKALQKLCPDAITWGEHASCRSLWRRSNITWSVFNVTLFYVVFAMPNKQKPPLRVVFTDVKRGMTVCEVTCCVEVCDVSPHVRDVSSPTW